MIAVNLIGGTVAGIIIGVAFWWVVFLIVAFTQWDFSLTQMSYSSIRFCAATGAIFGFCGATMEILNGSNGDKSK